MAIADSSFFILAIFTMKKLQLYPLPRVGVAFILGIVLGDHTSPDVPPWIWLALASACVVIAIGMERYRASLLILCATFFVGAWLVGNEESKGREPMVKADSSSLYPHPSCQGIIASRPVERGKVTRLDLWVVGKESPIKVRATILRDTLSGKDKALALGRGIAFRSRIKPIVNKASSQGFDYARWAQVHGYVGETFIRPDEWAPAIVPLSSLSWFQRTRLAAMAWREQIIRRMPTSVEGPSERSVIAAMSLGEKTTLSRETKDLYSATGASHVLALSGLHLGILFSILFIALQRKKAGILSQTLLLTSVWAYVVLTGMSPSIIRSATMLSVYSLVSLGHRHSLSLNTLAFAAVIMLIAHPLTLWDVGFQMSFLSVAAIIMAVQWTGVRGNIVTLLFVIPIAAQVATFPLVMYYFGRFPCYFLLSNVIVLPMAYIVLYGVLLWVILLPLTSISTFLFRIIEKVVEWGNDALSAIAALPYSSVAHIHISALQVCLIYILIICLLAIIHQMAKTHSQAKFLKLGKKWYSNTHYHAIP